MPDVRTRIAPSPTGDPHVGTAYIALFNYCFAKQHQGQFILRIEDTDQQRSNENSEHAILNSLHWLGLDWDEGPEKGGEFGPYKQSERTHIYRQHVDELIRDGHAYHCFRTPEELETIREQRRQAGLNPGIKGNLALPKAQVEERLAAGEPYVIRMHVPESGVCEINDMLRGTIEVDWSQVDEQILLKSDGMPTYHLANVVDDHLMQISHVIRGEEWISSAPKHLLLYRYFGWETPQFCHMPLLRNTDKSKLSKRKNPTSILYYQRMGFLAPALLNYLGRMGWSMPDEREKFSLAEMLAAFDIQRVSLGGPVFDIGKLRWLNGLWLREELDQQQFVEAFIKWGLNADYLMPAVQHVQQRVEVFSDVAPLAGFLLSGAPPISEQDFSNIKLGDNELLELLYFMLWRFQSVVDWNKDSLLAASQQLADACDIKLRHLLAPLFVVISGQANSIPVTDAMQILGSDMSRARILNAINTLGPASKKQLKRIEKRYAGLNLKESSSR